MSEKKYKIEDIMNKFNSYRSYKESNIIPNWRLIYSLYNGKFWDVFKEYVEDFTITPETNYVEYIVQAFMNSVYSGAFIGTLSAVRAGDEEDIQKLNNFVEHTWYSSGIKNQYLDIGRMGELYNFGPARVDLGKGNKVITKVLTQDEIYIDPQVKCYKEGEAIFIERAINIDKLKQDKDFGQEVEAYDNKNGNLGYTNKTLSNRLDNQSKQVNTKNRMVSLIEAFVRNEEGGIDQLYILDEKIIIYEKENLGVPCFPIVIYQPDRPQTDSYGTPKIMKIINTVIAINLLDSIEATHPYRLINRPRFVNISGQIDMRAFADYGNTPGAMFPVHGNPRDLIYYAEIPMLPDLTGLKLRMEQAIQNITGVDMAYRGRQTNSIQTTGATNAFQARVTMLTDNSRITMLEEFTEDLTKLILSYHFEYSGDTEFLVTKMSEYGTKNIVQEDKINFSDMNKKGVKYKYKLQASTLLPMNQANLFESAKILYEMQGQYQFPVRIVTEEDIVRFSDFPQKDIWLQRIAREKLNDVKTDVESTFKNAFLIYNKLIASGISEEEAARETINILIEEKQQMQMDPSLGKGFE